MKNILHFITWRRCMLLSIGVLLVLIVLNFYGLYSNKFYLLKPDNYIFPLLSIVHFVFLYVMWFKINEDELTDPKMRNLEYAMYALVMVYIFKIFDTAFILSTYNDFEHHIMPGTFMPIGLLMILLQAALLFLTLITFIHRKEEIGAYNFDSINENIDSWY